VVNYPIVDFHLFLILCLLILLNYLWGHYPFMVVEVDGSFLDSCYVEDIDLPNVLFVHIYDRDCIDLVINILIPLVVLILNM
jgi:hypothetical protein